MTEEIVRSDQRARLGRGLAALLGDAPPEVGGQDRAIGIRKLPIELLKSNPNNPRKNFIDVELDELAASIRERGVIQPILVRPLARLSDVYEIVAGERRWRAAQRANLHEVPIIVLDVNDREALEIAIIENVQRSDLNALEEAQGYTQLISSHGYSHNEIAQVVGKSRSHIANTLRLLALPDHAKSLLSKGSISAGHARALLSISDPNAVANQIVSKRLTVRDVERLGEHPRRLRDPDLQGPTPDSPDTKALEQSLSSVLGAQVRIRCKGEGGDIRIDFKTLEQLEEFCRRLTTEIGLPDSLSPVGRSGV